MAMTLQQMDDFVLLNLPDYEKGKWEDISIPLKELMFRHVIGKAKPEEQHGAMAKWEVQLDYDDNFKVTGLHDQDTSSRKQNMTQAQMFWSYFTDNYTYDLREDQFSDGPTAIVKWLDVKEHGLMNSFWMGMEGQLFGTGPTTPIYANGKPPMCSLSWWLPAYNANVTNQTAAGTLPTGTTSGFYGADPAGFLSVGTGGISRASVPGWRHRVGTYNVFSEDDAIDTILECMHKCEFIPASAYSELAPTTDPSWMLLTTYSRLKLAGRISSSQNDNMKGNITKFKNAVLINGVPLLDVPIWRSSTVGGGAYKRTDGPVMGVNWKTWVYKTKASLNMLKSPPQTDPNNKTFGRWRPIDHSCQLMCQNSRGNFIVTSTGTITESD
jgi:hypothetical protein